jgi:hypothetical protein
MKSKKTSKSTPRVIFGRESSNRQTFELGLIVAAFGFAVCALAKLSQ